MQRNASGSSPSERRNFFRIRTVLPILIEREGSVPAGPPAPMEVDISGGGIGFRTASKFDDGEALTVTIALPGEPDLRAKARVVACHPIHEHPVEFKVGICFTEIAQRDRDRLIRYIVRLQTERLEKHYLA